MTKTLERVWLDVHWPVRHEPQEKAAGGKLLPPAISTAHTHTLDDLNGAYRQSAPQRPKRCGYATEAFLFAE